MRIVRDTDDCGLRFSFADTGDKIIAPVAAGILTELCVAECRQLDLEEALIITADKPGMIALDGEREVKVNAGDTLTFRIRRNGPWRVDIHKALETAQKTGVFKR
jgi:hypothetical protein